MKPEVGMVLRINRKDSLHASNDWGCTYRIVKINESSCFIRLRVCKDKACHDAGWGKKGEEMHEMRDIQEDLDDMDPLEFAALNAKKRLRELGR